MSFVLICCALVATAVIGRRVVRHRRDDLAGPQRERWRAEVDPLLEAVVDLVWARRLRTARRIIKRNPRLLDAEAGRVIRDLAIAIRTGEAMGGLGLAAEALTAMFGGKSLAVGEVEYRRRLLECCRRFGVRDVRRRLRAEVVALQLDESAGALIDRHKELLRRRAAPTPEAAEALERAIGRLRAAVEMSMGETPEHAGFESNLGRALRLRYAYTESESTADLDEAIRCHRAALTFDDPSNPSRRKWLNNLGNSLYDRYFHTGSLDDLDEAIQCHCKAVSLFETLGGEVVERQSHLRSLAGCLITRYSTRSQSTRAPADRDGAIKALAEYAELAAEGGDVSIGFVRDVVTLLVDRWSRSPAGRLQPVPSRDHLEGLLVQGLFERTHQYDVRNADDFELAVRDLREAIDRASEGSPTWSILNLRLGKTYRDRAAVADALGHRRDAVSAYRKVCEQGRSAGPHTVMQAAAEWGQLAAAQEQWSEAVEAYDHGLRIMEELSGTQTKRENKEIWLAHAKTLAAEGAHAASRAADPWRAVASLEQGRAVVLREIQETGQDETAASPSDSVVYRDREHWVARRTREIVAVAGTCPLLYVSVARAAGLAFIVRGRDITQVDLPGVTGADLDKKVDDYLCGLRSQPDSGAQPIGEPTDGSAADQPVLDRSLDDVTHWLWDRVMGPILGMLPADVHDLVIVAGGLLGQLPLHAAWTPDGSGRRYALDTHAISYAPNARSLHEARRLAGEEPPRRLLAVADPYLGLEERPLWMARYEAMCAAAAFPTAPVVVQGREATFREFERKAPNADVLHLACHGSADRHDPLQSRLELAGGPVKMGRMRELDLRVRLAVLSACETAQPGLPLPDEVLGLPTGLLQAHAAGVVAALWRVKDDAAAMLMVEFYRGWQQEGLTPAAALAAAQRWLRDTTNGEKRHHFEAAPDDRGSWLPPEAKQAFIDNLALMTDDENARNYERIRHWGAFAHVGA
jgi:CHAT domain-containing protein/tetratricopeptide (TPR) repeat protein